LQELYDNLWAQGDRTAARAKAIALRGRYPENSPDYKTHQAIVAKLHREISLILRERGSEVLSDADRATFEKVLGIK
jgi:hypothetical protein